MLPNFKKFLTSKIGIGVSALAIGFGGGLAVHELIKSASSAEEHQLMAGADDPYFSDPLRFMEREMDRQLEHMQKRLKRWDQEFWNDFPDRSSSDFFSSWPGSKKDRSFWSSSPSFSLKSREDDEFLYYEIPVRQGPDNQVNVKVENGMITLEGQVSEERENNQDEQTRSYSSSVSSFHQSFPIPSHVDPDSVKMETTDDRLIVKFRKLKT